MGPRFGHQACGGDAGERLKQLQAGNKLVYPFTLPGFGTFDKQVTGQRTFDYNTNGLATVGQLPDLVADLKNVGLPNKYLNVLFRSAEEYIKVWEKAEGTFVETPQAVCIAFPTLTLSEFQSSGPPNEGNLLSLSVSSSPPATALAWNFDDGTTGSGSPVQHTFSDNGTFNVRVTATDTSGDPGAAKTFPLTIANVAPTATFTVPTTVDEGSPIDLELTSPFDPSTADVAAGLQFALDCGTGFNAFSSTATRSCSTDDNGSRSVRRENPRQR